MLYANLSNHTVSVCTGTNVYIFQPGGYCAVLPELAAGASAGVLTLVEDDYPSTHPNVQPAIVQSLVSNAVSINLFFLRELWLGARGAPDGTHRATTDSLTVFTVTSGNDDYGNAVHVLGSDDTPITDGKTKLTVSRLYCTALSSSTPWKLRVAWGTGTFDEAVAAGDYTEVVLAETGHVTVFSPKLDVGTNLWVQGWNATNLATLSFLYGIQEHDT